MRVIRSLVVVAATVLAFMVAVPSVAAAEPDHVGRIHLTKDCSAFSGTVPSYCTFVGSNIPEIQPGAKAWYWGPVLDDPITLHSKVVIDAGYGSTATGRCRVTQATGNGSCTFTKGTGQLAGFHARVKVTVDATGLWHWDGKYWFTRQVRWGHLVKNCDSFTGLVPSFCTFTSSDIGALTVGAKAFYWGPVLDDPITLHSKVILDDGAGNTATGRCRVTNATGIGHCTFWKGTGALAGFHASFHVTVDAAGLWHWTGKYHFSHHLSH